MIYFAKKRSLAVLLILSLAACSSDSVKISTSSNNGTGNPQGPGFSVGMAASSADGNEAVNINSGGQVGAAAQARYTYQTFEAAAQTFCLQGASGKAEVELIDQSGNTQLILSSDGCGIVELPVGRHTLAAPENSSVERVPGDCQEESFTLIAVR